MKKKSLFVPFFLYGSLFCILWLAGVLMFTALFQVKPLQNAETPETPGTQTMLPTPISSGFSVLAVVSEDESLVQMYLCHTDFVRDTMSLISVPMNTRTELSRASLEVLSSYQPEMPSLFMPTELYRLFPGKKFCMAAEEMFSGLLGTRPKACYVIHEKLFETFTKKKNGTIEFIAPKDIRKLLLTIHRTEITNRTETEDLIYLESYRDIGALTVSVLPGKDEVQFFRPDTEALAELVLLLTEGRNLSEEERTK